MPTTPYSVTEAAWQQIGTAPCVVECKSVQPTCLYVGTALPSLGETGFTVLRNDDPDGFPVTAPGQNVYARAFSQQSNGAVTPIAAPGGSGSGGGASAIVGSMEQDVRNSGTLNAASTSSVIDIPVNGQSTVGLRFSGLTGSGATIAYFQSNDGGTTETGVNAVNAGTGVAEPTRNTDGQTRISVSGRTNLKIRVSVAGTGAISVAWNVSVREGIVTLGSPLPQLPASLGIKTAGASLPVALPSDGTLPLPAGAATAAKQPALGTAGTPSTDVITVQGIATGTPQPVIPAQPDSVISTYTVTGIGATVGVPLTGYGSALVELTGTFSATSTVQVSTDSTDGINGTWTDAFGFVPENTGTQGSATPINQTTRRRLYRAQDGSWLRFSTSVFTSGPINVAIVRKIAPLSERNVFLGGGSVGLTAGTNVIGSTTLRSAGTNRSATVGTTASTLMAANTGRQGWEIKNDTAGDIWINFDAAATAAAGGGNMKIVAGAYRASEPGFVATGTMSVIGSATGLAITAREY